MLAYESAIRRVAVGFGIVACVGCRSANTTQVPSQGTQAAPADRGEQIHGLMFDPMGADFSKWVTHFTREVYRNWIMPQPALEGTTGRVDIEFAVERDGTLSRCRILISSTIVAMDKAAKYALESSQFIALPGDYGPASVTMRASFFYNESPNSRD